MLSPPPNNHMSDLVLIFMRIITFLKKKRGMETGTDSSFCNLLLSFQYAFEKWHVLLACKRVYLKYLTRVLSAAFWLVSMVAGDGQNKMVFSKHTKKQQKDTSVLQQTACEPL